MNILNIIKTSYTLLNRDCEIIYITKEYLSICGEESLNTIDSYAYQYVKPTEIVTANHKIYAYDDVFLQLKQRDQLVEDLWVEYNDFRLCPNSRTRQHILHILPEACPLKIKYAAGSGEGYKNSEFWSSERREYWVLYLREPC
jgi:hypothetical protein